jgi:hypothetical protein
VSDSAPLIVPVVSVLERARALVANGWSKETSARNENGFKVRWESPEAVQFCAGGALSRALMDETKTWSQKLIGSLMSSLLKKLPPGSIANWNDKPERTKDEVLSLFDTLIAEQSSL